MLLHTNCIPNFPFGSAAPGSVRMTVCDKKLFGLNMERGWEMVPAEGLAQVPEKIRGVKTEPSANCSSCVLRSEV